MISTCHCWVLSPNQVHLHQLALWTSRCHTANVLLLSYLKSSGRAVLSCYVEYSSSGWKFSDGLFSPSEICQFSEKEAPQSAGIPVQVHQVPKETFLTTLPVFLLGWHLGRPSGIPGNVLLGRSSILESFLLKIMAHAPAWEFQPLNYGTAVMWWLCFHNSCNVILVCVVGKILWKDFPQWVGDFRIRHGIFLHCWL